MLNAIAGKFMASPSNRTASREGDSVTGIAAAGTTAGALQSGNGQSDESSSSRIVDDLGIIPCFNSDRGRSAESEITIWGAERRCNTSSSVHKS